MAKLIGKVLGTAIAAYIAAYAGLAAFDIHNYLKNKEKILENAPNHLIVKEYPIKVNGVNKQLALIGENHAYTKKETAYALDIINKYKNVALEGSYAKTEDKAFKNAVSALISAPGYFYSMGSGRFSAGSDFLSAIYAKNKFCLQDKNSLDELDSLQKLIFLGESAKAALTAPLKYFEGKSENKLSATEYEDYSEKRANKIWKNRETEMSRNIETLLKRKDIDRLVCFVGASHLKPIEDNLKKKISLKRK